jgi:molecular chaperone DnaJ
MDFYILLGVTPDASTADIKRAYRRLARRYHPGVNPGDRAAEAMFQRVSEAYETLSDPGRRRQYDIGGGADAGGSDRPVSSFIFSEFDFSVARQGAQASTFTELFADVLHPMPPPGERRPEAGSDLHVTVTIPFAEAARGAERHVLVTRQVTCGACRGLGQVATREGKCSHCQGAGQVRWARGHMIFSKTCAACLGEGRQGWLGCVVCGGQGRTVRSDATPIPVPAGIADGARLRLPGLGQAGRYGGESGDLYVTVQVQPHAFFWRDGDDLRSDLPVAVHEAVLGARVEVPTLDGPVKLRIPPGTQAGQRLRLPGLGLPTAAGGQGDVVFDVKLVLPKSLDERSRELMREFAERNRENVREGFELEA